MNELDLDERAAVAAAVPALAKLPVDPLRTRRPAAVQAPASSASYSSCVNAPESRSRASDSKVCTRMASSEDA